MDLFDSGSEYLGHHVDFRTSKIGQRMIPMLVFPSLLVTQMAYIILYTLDTHILIYMIYISGPCVSITHECYFTVVDLDLLTCDIVDAWATCS